MSTTGSVQNELKARGLPQVFLGLRTSSWSLRSLRLFLQVLNTDTDGYRGESNERLTLWLMLFTIKPGKLTHRE